MRALIIIVIVLAAGAIGETCYFESQHRHAIAGEAAALTGGNPDQGHELIRKYGCIACHEVPGFAGTSAYVGPPLDKFGLRMYVAGAAENKPHELIQFLRDPRHVVPHGAMPNLGVKDQDARDLAAFLYTLQ